MNRRRITHFALTAMMAISLTGLSAYAQKPDLNLSNAQVSHLQALLLSQTTELRSLQSNVQAAQETLRSALEQGDAVRTAMAILSLDAAEKALKNTESANQRDLLSLLNASQKQLLGNSSVRAIPVSD
jgi:hypothetical protein